MMGEAVRPSGDFIEKNTDPRAFEEAAGGVEEHIKCGKWASLSPSKVKPRPWCRGFVVLGDGFSGLRSR
jgi:hypothetical protein